MLKQIGLGLVLAAVWAGFAAAEIPDMSDEELQQAATHIAVGDVKGIFSESERDESYLTSRGVLEIMVRTVEKGDKIEPMEALYARFWTQKWIGKGDPEPGASGNDLPRRGDTVRVHLKREQGVYKLLLPNGCKVIARPAPND